MKEVYPGQVAMDAFEVLVRDQAAPKTHGQIHCIRKMENIPLQRLKAEDADDLIDDAAVGASLEDSKLDDERRPIEILRHATWLSSTVDRICIMYSANRLEVRSYGFMEDCVSRY